MVLTAAISVPHRGRGGDLPRGVRAEQPVHASDRDEHRQPRRRPVRSSTDLLGLGVFVRALQHGSRSCSPARLTLALLVLPIVIIASREALRAVPTGIREGAFALGATRWEVVRHQVLPAAIPGIMTGTILALSRAIGETAPLHRRSARSPISRSTRRRSVSSPRCRIQILNWVVRPQADFARLAAAGEPRPARGLALDERGRDLAAEPVPEGVVRPWVTSQPVRPTTDQTTTRTHPMADDDREDERLRGPGSLRVLRGLPRAPRRHPRHRPKPDHRDHRTLRLREVDA